MPKTVKDVTPAREPESLAELRRDCARMAPHWTGVAAPAGRPRPHGTPLSLIHGVVVPARSARLLDAMSDYGD
ncbi:hypothetical protein BLA24_01090 [Streptomyces cinnamoneus]|uniref:Uncharacterized protein n=1 Tax=Streptomyces cinnamoneus TaxID=53446 RepID=A0A2G1XGJ2_STRCJ|nr:hypothetical protein [Streptomyces cinnamoneus]PHQ50351.1 hypothetical protein BLA24_22690 [Streptomyces cinnamoneus]PHQ50352.1 hypothetical protein BLA24_22705 [Streptomyces cinnamoneus]PHQ53556.1 hypothetical protein BLA24_01090 [Streptomyces cinnamoneus]PPT12861.1 hypothetical protein CYQ11_08100 [Streptomyces cinnamoneus]